MPNSKKPEVPRSLKERGYDWMSESTDNVGKDLAEVLNKNNAQCFLLDVYATGDKIFRNIKCILEEYPGIETELNVSYHKETGKSFTISKH